MILLFIVAVIGMTHIIVDSTIMEPVEEWMEGRLPPCVHNALFNCYQCSGFWCGVVLSPLVSFNPFIMFACGCAGSFVTDFSESAFKFLESNHAS